MDWSLVIERLRWFGKNSTEQANALILEYAKLDDVNRHRERADLYLALASALEAGMPVHDIDG